MYFDIEPKRRPDDFYNMEDELRAFIDSVTRYRLIVVKGLRRYGKTSLVLTGLSLIRDRNHIFIDCRLLPPNPSLEDLLALIEDEVSRRSWARRLLESVEHVDLGGVIRFKPRRHETLVRIFESLGNTILVFDEAQRLRGLRLDVGGILAYLYDHTDIRIVVTGSEVGVLENFLKLEDPEAPLYGRPYAAISLKPLPRDKALEFLRLGFEQAGVDVDPGLLEKAVDTLDGIVGWLTYLGYEYIRGGAPLEEILEKASRLALKELEGFLNLVGIARERYLEALRTIASLGRATWSDVKTRIEARLGRVPETALANILKKLTDYGYIVKENREYRIADPVLRHALKHLDRSQPDH